MVWNCRGAFCRVLGARPPEEAEEEDDGSLASAQIGILIWFLVLLLLIGAAAFLLKKWAVLPNAFGNMGGDKAGKLEQKLEAIGQGSVVQKLNDAKDKAAFLKNDPKKRCDPMADLERRREMYEDMLRVHGQELTLLNGPLPKPPTRAEEREERERARAEAEAQAASAAAGEEAGTGAKALPGEDADMPLPLKETVEQIGATLAVLEDDVQRQRRALREHVI